MNIWLLLGAIVILWAFAFSLMYLSFWLEERAELYFDVDREDIYISSPRKRGMINYGS